MTAISTSQREKLAGGPGGPEVFNSNNQKSPLYIHSNQILNNR